jgi:HAD superfamily hydrolase (TIGR01490 family)
MNPIKRVVFFDMDHTLLKGHSQKLFMWHLLDKGLLSKRLCLQIALKYLMYETGLMTDFTCIRKQAFSMLKGGSVCKMKALFDDFVDNVVAKRIRPNMLNVIKVHKENNDILVLISASMQEIAERVASSFGLDYTIATKLETRNGLYTGTIKYGPVYAEEKAFAAKRFIQNKGLSLKGSFAYSDSVSDLPLLFLVDNPVAVCPDNALRKVSQKMSWMFLF